MREVFTASPQMLCKCERGGMRRSTITEQDQQADDLEAAAVEMRALAEALRRYPVSLAEVAGELGNESVDRLAYQLGADVFRDDLGRRVISRDKARELISERDAAERARTEAAQRQAAQQHAANERHNREREAMLASVDALNARFPGDPNSPATSLFFRAELEARALDELALLDEEALKARTARRYDENGRLIDANGNVITP
jgi:hypothetical protein